MKEVGINISRQRLKNVDIFLNENFDYVMTVCDHAREVCLFFPGGRARLHQSFENPSQSEGTEEEKLAAFRKVRDEIGEWIRFTFRPTISLDQLPDDQFTTAEGCGLKGLIRAARENKNG